MLRPRWVFLRALGLVFLSAFQALGVRQLWYAPTVFWMGAGDHALTLVVALGLVASILLVANVAPKYAVAGCTICFMSCVAVLQDFSAYRSDGRTSHLRYRPQNPMEHPGIFAPHQPRFDWSPAVLALFRDVPFPDGPPTQVRTVLRQYWFTDPATKRRTGAWWRREEIGPFTGTLERTPEGGYALH